MYFVNKVEIINSYIRGYFGFFVRGLCKMLQLYVLWNKLMGMDYTCSNRDKITKSVSFGDHICSIYKNKEQLFSHLVPYIVDGLCKDQLCVYAYDDNTKEEIEREFEKKGFALEKYLKSGQLQLLNKDEAYVRGGKFDVNEMIKTLKQIEKVMKEKGYSGVRTAGEMTGFLDGVPGSEKLIEYESKLNDFIGDKKFVTLCLYNEKKFNRDVLNNVIRTHPHIILYGEPHENKYFYTAPEYFKEKTDAIPADSYETVLDIIEEE